MAAYHVVLETSKGDITLAFRPDKAPEHVRNFLRLAQSAPYGFASVGFHILHIAGTLSMARADDPASASTSFFICTAPAPSLDGKYTAFGEVIAGMDIVQTIEAARVIGDLPLQKIELRHVRVEKQ